VIRQLAERLEMHRLRAGNPEKGPIFVNGKGNPLALGSLVNRVILPALNRCEFCGKAELEHRLPDQKEPRHSYKRDSHIPDWHGWHAARRGLGSNLYRLGVPDMVIQRILRHANVSTTSTYYIKTAAADVRNAMAKLENVIPNTQQISEPREHSERPDTFGTTNLDSTVVPSTIN
jgi:integrase